MPDLDRRVRLEAARDALAEAIGDCTSKRDLPPLVREYRATLAELELIPNRAEVSHADEVAAKRAARRTGASGSSRSARSG